MNYKVEFEDHGQDLLRIEVDEETGKIVSAGSYHNEILYTDEVHYVDVEYLKVDRMVRCWGDDGVIKNFAWPMMKLSLGDEVIKEIVKH